MTTTKGLSQRERDSILKDLAQVRATELVARINPDEPAWQGPALVNATCPCGQDILIQPGRVSEPTKAVCPDCAEEIIREAKANGLDVTVVKKANPPKLLRVQDKVHPINVRTRMPIDLKTISDAELGAIVRKRMIEQKLAVMETEVPKAEKAKGKKEKKEDKAHKKARQAKHDVLPEIRVERQTERKGVSKEGLVIPALDVNEVTSLDDVVPLAVRQPYNKALYHLKGDEAMLPQDVTYATLLGTHRAIAAAVAEYKPKSKKKGEPEAVPEVDPQDQQEMLTAIMAAFDCDEKQARKHLKKYLKEHA